MRHFLIALALTLPLALPAATPKPAAPAAPVVEAPTPEPTVEVVKAPAAVEAQTPVPAKTETVAVLHKPKADPDAAFKAAFWPGILLHGAGYREAGDTDTFVNLAGGEIFSAVLLGFGLAEALGPDIKDESKATSQSIAAAGGVIFVGTWLWDIAGASGAARKFNEKNGLSLSPKGDGAQVALALQF